MSKPTAPGWQPDPHDVSVGAVVFSVFAVISAMAFVGQFGDSGQRSGQSFNIFPALFALGWGSGAHRLWNPKP
jgi:hypothetical protein